MKSRIAKACLMIGITLASSTAQAGTVHDASNDFSLVSNPNGVWSYGYATSLNGTFTLDSSTTSVLPSPFENWHGPVNGAFPYVAFNTSSLPDTYITIIAPAHSIVMHPGPDGEYSILRFTADATATYSIAASFLGLDVGGTTTDTHVFLDASSLYGGAINGYGNSGSYSNSSIALNAGDTLEVLVGNGGNGYSNDATGVGFTVTELSSSLATPEPATLISALAGCVLGAIVIGRRRKASSV